ncbi:hypothetical protein F4560_008700 [Saccharothrix ecbatanensis]|uniref:GH26 domain-containing protein n=1 Tax=Saccharothrix ecbatanensis TaxID=1105145 RepID=A0A7W9M654_9PSEU|nr:glycosyl hydrolase [Saccharothrix ecbatanensis]MBB5808932.1 hypothetical protein [Saccharothrix ecbatanensis]
MNVGSGRLVGHHGLHNLIWVWNSISPDWYPGDDMVDVVSADVGDHSALVGQYDRFVQLGGDRKLVALGEVGSISDPDLVRAYEARWSWMNPPDQVTSQDQRNSWTRKFPFPGNQKIARGLVGKWNHLDRGQRRRMSVRQRRVPGEHAGPSALVRQPLAMPELARRLAPDPAADDSPSPRRAGCSAKDSGATPTTPTHRNSGRSTPRSPRPATAPPTMPRSGSISISSQCATTSTSVLLTAPPRRSQRVGSVGASQW